MVRQGIIKMIDKVLTMLYYYIHDKKVGVNPKEEDYDERIQQFKA